MMQRLMLLAMLLQGAVAPTPPSAPQPADGSIEGVVVSEGNEPIEDARVTLFRRRSPLPGTFDESFLLQFPDPWAFADMSSVVRSDRDGRFHFTGLAPGQYKLDIAANGYVYFEYGPLSVAAGQTLKDIAVRLTPAGVISGRLRDPDKLPLAGVPIRLMRYAYDRTGQRVVRSVPNQITFTNDRGEYRLYFITPGRYLLNAGTPSGPSGAYEGKPSRGNDGIEDAFAYAFYPGVTHVSEATVIEVRAGVELSGIDWSIGRQQRYTIRGRVIDAVNGQSPTKVALHLNYRDVGGIEYSADYRGESHNLLYENGAFEFRDVLPGSYSVSGSIGDGQSPRQGYVPVEVASSNVESLVLTIPPAALIRGRWTVEVAGSPSATMEGKDAFVVALEPSVNGWTSPATIPGVPTPQPGSVKTDGTFVIESVTPGEYRVSLSWLKPGFYLKQARFDGADALDHPFQFNGQDSSILTVTIGSNTASLEGVAVNERLDPMPASQVVLVPGRRDRIDLFKTVIADQNGRFSFTNITPGNYKLFAWEVLEPFGYFDPEILSQVEEKGLPTPLAELSKMNVSVKVIPAAAP